MAIRSGETGPRVSPQVEEGRNLRPWQRLPEGNDTRGHRRCQHWQAEQRSLPGLKLSNPIAAESGIEDEGADNGRQHHCGRGLAGLQLPLEGGTASRPMRIRWGLVGLHLPLEGGTASGPTSIGSGQREGFEMYRAG